MLERMVVLSVILGLLVLLAAACVWEGRTGRAEWGRRSETRTDPRAAAQIAATTAVIIAADMGGDG